MQLTDETTITSFLAIKAFVAANLYRSISSLMDASFSM